MNAAQILEVMLALVPQLEPMLDPCNPDFTVIMNDGGLIDTSDTEDQKWEMLDVTRQFYRREIKTEDDLRKAIADYIPHAAYNEVMAGYEPLLPAVIGNYFYNLMYHASWKLHAEQNPAYRREYADKLVAYLNRIAPQKFATVPQKYFDAFKLGL